MKNIVQFEYALLDALTNRMGSEVLDNAIVTRDYNTTKFGFKIGENRRAVVSIDLEDIKLCDHCGEELEFPRYQETVHSKCKDKVTK